MQLAHVDSGRSVGPRTIERHAATRSDAATRIAATTESQASDAARHARSARTAPMRGGLRSFDIQLNQRIAAVQRTVEFLERADAQLQSIRTALAAHIGPGRAEPASDIIAELSYKIHQFESLWRERVAATGGALDSQLDQVEPGEAQLRFKVRGLTIDTLANGEPETLYLAVGGRTQHAVAVVIEPGLDATAIAQRFDRALAPSGVRVSRDRHGELVFSVRETDWANTRDILAIKGDGRRFPTGQFAIPRIVPEEPLVRPDLWTVDSPMARRATLQQVIDAQEAVRHARQLALEMLSDEGHRLQTADATACAQEGKWCEDFVRTFATTAGRRDYRTLAALSSAVHGIHRDRVRALLLRM